MWRNWLAGVLVLALFPFVAQAQEQESPRFQVGLSSSYGDDGAGISAAVLSLCIDQETTYHCIAPAVYFKDSEGISIALYTGYEHHHHLWGISAAILPYDIETASGTDLDGMQFSVGVSVNLYGLSASRPELVDYVRISPYLTLVYDEGTIERPRDEEIALERRVIAWGVAFEYEMELTSGALVTFGLNPGFGRGENIIAGDHQGWDTYFRLGFGASYRY